MQNTNEAVVILGTGGTIAGTAADVADNVGYTAAQLGVEQLVRAVPALAGATIECQQVAQLDSKDMDFATWLRLATRIAQQLARADVAGVVVTHGTDTLEETAYFLQRVLAPTKPVVLTAAMRPATALQTDGPQNLLDAVCVAQLPGARGVVVVFGGEVHGAADVRKLHTYRLAAFGSGDAGVLAQIEEGVLRPHRPWPGGAALGLDWLREDVAAWPRVEIVHSHAGADGRLVQSLCADGVHGIVIAGTGNGSLHHALEAALRQAQAQAVSVLRSSRCLDGAVLGAIEGELPGAGALTPVKARIELMLQLMRA
ncbi:MAG: asparaginase [Burkholderiales bacterium]